MPKYEQAMHKPYKHPSNTCTKNYVIYGILFCKIIIKETFILNREEKII
jgi:hypothetical protein